MWPLQHTRVGRSGGIDIPIRDVTQLHILAARLQLPHLQTISNFGSHGAELTRVCRSPKAGDSTFCRPSDLPLPQYR